MFPRYLLELRVLVGDIEVLSARIEHHPAVVAEGAGNACLPVLAPGYTAGEKDLRDNIYAKA